MMTADELLSLAPRDAGVLFSGGEDEISKSFRKFMLAWHPDHSTHPRASEVMQKIMEMRRIALDRLHGKISGAKFHVIDAVDGTKKKMSYLRSHSIEVGTIYIGSETVAFEIDGKFSYLIEKAKAFTPKFKDDAMKKEIERVVAKKKFDVATRVGHFFAYERRPNQVLLRDLMSFCGVVDPKHVAWMITRMMNFAAWMDYSGVSLGNLGPDTLLVSVDDHQLSLVGPYLFATSFGVRPKTLPSRSVEVASNLLDKSAVADSSIDLELVRLTARELLGDATGTKMLRDSKIPQPMSMWLNTTPKKKAVDDFFGWEAIREKSFGSRKFVKWDLDPRDVYQY